MLIMSQEMQIALIGVFGTLAGTVLGWILNNISKKGKVNIYILSFDDEFIFHRHEGAVCSRSIENAKSYHYELLLDIYNSSNERRTLRNPTFIFSDGKNELIKREALGSISDIINVDPKTGMRVKFHDVFHHNDDGFESLWNATNVHLHYANERGKIIKIKINSKTYKDYFDNQKNE